MKASTIIFNGLITTGIILLSGCTTRIINLTPNRIPENPSGIYTFSLATKLPKTNIDRESTQAVMVIDGQHYAMERTDRGKEIFAVDYKVPPSVNELAYYYVVEFDSRPRQRIRRRKFSSKLYRAQLVNRYVLQLENDRAPVGAKVAIIGRGLSPYDVILFDNYELPTEYISPNSLNFIVPNLSDGRDYSIALRTSQGNIPIGKFHIDVADISVLLEQAAIRQGEETIVLFTIDFEAPPDGLYINVTTDIPASIIMPEVVIPPGSRSVSVPLQGGVPGEGNLFVEMPGFNPVEAPITVY